MRQTLFQKIFKNLNCTESALCEPGSYSASISTPTYGHTLPASYVFTLTTMEAPTVVSIPTIAWLFGSALLGLGALKRKKGQG